MIIYVCNAPENPLFYTGDNIGLLSLFVTLQLKGFPLLLNLITRCPHCLLSGSLWDLNVLGHSVLGGDY